MKKYLYLVLAVIALSISCEKDDICAAETPTTPHLILRFYDVANPDEFKDVPTLYAYALDDDDNIVDFLSVTTSTKDSLAIPLRTDADETKIVLHRNYNQDNVTDGNADTVDISYIREDVYVSRSCGYKTIFNNVAFSVQTDGDNWIISSGTVVNPVENEIQAHVKILH